MSAIPSKWISTVLSEIAYVEMGQSPDSRFYNDQGKGLPFYQGKAEFGKLYPNVRKWCSEPTKVAESGDILLSVRAPVGPTNVARERSCIGRGLAAIRGYGGLEQKYLLYFFRNIEPWLMQQGTGTTFTAISGEFIRNIEIPLAPIDEQKRIADKLDALMARVDACCEHLERVEEILKRFRQAVLFLATNGQLTEDWRKKNGLETPEGQDSTISFDFLDTDCFGSYQFPASWGIHRLGEIANITGGITKDSKKQNPNDPEIPYLRVANVQRGFLNLDEVKTIRVQADRLDELKLQPGDILFNEGGDLDKLGRGWIWSGEIEPCVFQNHVFRARLKDEHFASKFFSFYGNSRGYDYFLTYGKQTTNLASINKTLLEALPVVVPHPDEQHEIVRRVDALFAHSDQIEARYRSANDLVKSLPTVILGKAFRGELVTQNPDDEPASLLLERIKEERAKQAQLPKPESKVSKPRETKMTEAELKEIIRKLPGESFSFDDLREKIPGDYEQIKKLLFSVLSETDALISQVFDPKVEAIRFVRREK